MLELGCRRVAWTARQPYFLWWGRRRGGHPPPPPWQGGRVDGVLLLTPPDPFFWLWVRGLRSGRAGWDLACLGQAWDGAPGSPRSTRGSQQTSAQCCPCIQRCPRLPCPVACCLPDPLQPLFRSMRGSELAEVAVTLSSLQKASFNPRLCAQHSGKPWEGKQTRPGPTLTELPSRGKDLPTAIHKARSSALLLSGLRKGSLEWPPAPGGCRAEYSQSLGQQRFHGDDWSREVARKSPLEN